MADDPKFFFTKAFAAELPTDPLEAGPILFQHYTELMKIGVPNPELHPILRNAHAMIRTFMRQNSWPPIKTDLTGGLDEDCNRYRNCISAMKGTYDKVSGEHATAEFAAIFETKAHGTTFDFDEPELARIQARLDELRKLIQSSEIENDHKHRLLKRL